MMDFLTSMLSLLANSLTKLFMVLAMILISLQHSKLDKGRFLLMSKKLAFHVMLFFVCKLLTTVWKRIFGSGSDHHYWSISDEIAITTLSFTARIGHCTATRKPIKVYGSIQRILSNILGHCCVRDIDLGLGRGAEDALYITLDKEQVFGSVPIVLFYHGGGYVIGNSDMYINAQYVWLTHMLEEHNVPCAVLSINYPLAPEVKFPENLYFAFRAYDAVLAHGICPSRIILAGDSAGGCMAMQVAKHAADVCLSSENKHCAVAGLVLISPWVSHSTDSNSHEKHEFTDFIAGPEVLSDFSVAYAPAEHNDALGNPCISPVHENEFDFLPSTLITCGSREVFFDDIMVFIDKLCLHKKNVKIVVGEDCPHIHPLLWPFFKKASRSGLGKIGDFCSKMLKAHESNLESCS